jgi:hypothetical protein
MKTLLEGIIEGFVREEPEQEHKPGDVWQTDGGAWAGMRIRDGETEWGFSDRERALAWVKGQDVAPDDKAKPKRQPTGGKDPQAGQQSPDDAIASDPALAALNRQAAPEDGEEKPDWIRPGSRRAIELDRKRKEEQEKIRRILARTGLSDSAARQVMKAENKRVRTMAFIQKSKAAGEIERIKSKMTSAKEFLKDSAKKLGLHWNSLGGTKEDRYAAAVQHLRNTNPEIKHEGMNLDELLQKATAKSAAGQLSSLSSESLTVIGSKKALEILNSSPYYEKEQLDDSDLVKISEQVCADINEEYQRETNGDGQIDQTWINASCGQVLQTMRNVTELGMDVREIEDFYWDTQTGNQLAGTLDHGTSSDYMVVMKDGTTIGNSLKKDGQIYFANLGTQSFVASAVASLPDDEESKAARDILMPGGVNIAQKVIDDANVELNNHFQQKKITGDQMQEALAELCRDKSKAGMVFMASANTDAKKYCDKLGPSAIGKLFDETGNFTGVETLKVDERSFLCRFSAGSGADIFKGVEKTCRSQDAKVTAAMVDAAEASAAFKRQLQASVVKGLHILEHLGLGDPPPDIMVTSFGRGRLNRENIFRDVFKLDDQKIDELNAQITEANDPETSSERRKEIQQQVESFFTDKIDLTYEDGSFRAQLVFDDGEPVPVAELSNRAKGNGRKTDTLIAPSKELKKIIGGNVGKTLKLEQQEESLSPREQQLRNELKKLVRDIAINRLGDYGN